MQGIKNFEEITKEVVRPKLTIAKERVTLKIPVNTPADVVARVRKVALQAAEHEQSTLELTLRGQFWQDERAAWYVVLSPENDSLVRMYREVV